MKFRSVVLIAVAFLLLASVYTPPSEAGVEVGVGVNIGLPVVTFAAPPAMVVIPGTNAYFVPDVDADVIFYGGRWYRPWGGRWYWAAGYNGPWVVAGPGFVVPSSILYLRPGWRRTIVIHERIPYNNFYRNWRTWERDRYWERHYDWWRQGKIERDRDRREIQRERKDIQRDRKDIQRDRRDVERDRRDVQRDRREAERDRQKDIQRDRKGGQGLQGGDKGMKRQGRQEGVQGGAKGPQGGDKGMKGQGRQEGMQGGAKGPQGGGRGGEKRQGGEDKGNR